MANSSWTMFLNSYLNLWRLILWQIIILKKVLQKLLWWLILVSCFHLLALFFWSHSRWLPLFVWVRVSYFWIYKRFIIFFDYRTYCSVSNQTTSLANGNKACSCFFIQLKLMVWCFLQLGVAIFIPIHESAHYSLYLNKS